MNRQSNLAILKMTPLGEKYANAHFIECTTPLGERYAGGRFIECTYVNKGKKYPYESTPKCLRRTGLSSRPSSSTLGSLLTRLGAASGMARSSTAATPSAT